MNCGLDGEYQQRVALAREQCDPSASPAPTSYWYETRAGTVEYHFAGQLWKRGEPRYQEPTAFPPDIEHPPPSASIPPCGPREVNPSVAIGYNKTVRLTDDVTEVLPVCSSDPGAPKYTPQRNDPTTVTVEFVEVVHILGCQRNVTVEVGVGDDPPNEGGDARSPKRVIDDVSLGDEAFRIRSLMHGDFTDAGAGRIVRLALHGRVPPDSPLAKFAVLGEYSVAASEYFYNGAEGRDAWMWNMKWRARFRRFDVPAGDASGIFLGRCGMTIGTDCGAATGILEGFGDVIAH
jgi:hypothetical protein